MASELSDLKIGIGLALIKQLVQGDARIVTGKQSSFFVRYVSCDGNRPGKSPRQALSPCSSDHPTSPCARFTLLSLRWRLLPP